MNNRQPKLIGHTLSNRYLIMSSDDDQPRVIDLYVGFNFRGELTIAADLTDYERRGCNCSTAAIVNRDDAASMARRYGMGLGGLPRLIAGSMADWGDIVNPSCASVRACFKEATERLLDEGCRFRIERTVGSHGAICC